MAPNDQSDDCEQQPLYTLDGCQMFCPSSSDTSVCDACGCDARFHDLPVSSNLLVRPKSSSSSLAPLKRKSEECLDRDVVRKPRTGDLYIQQQTKAEQKHLEDFEAIEEEDDRSPISSLFKPVPSEEHVVENSVPSPDDQEETPAPPVEDLNHQDLVTIDGGESRVETSVPVFVVKFAVDKRQLSFLSRFLASNSRPHQCSVCLRSFGSKSNLQCHKQKHALTIPGQLECMFCLGKFGNQVQKLLEHLLVHSVQSKPFHCPKCEASFPVESNMSAHVRSNCSQFVVQDQTSFNSDVSATVVESLSASELKFMRSKFVWTEGRPYQCSKCLVCYKNTSDLKKHNHIGADEEDVEVLECYFCNMEFAKNNVDDLLIHIGKWHSKGLAFLCRLCNVTFLNAAALTTHRKGNPHQAKEASQKTAK
eukprot:TRINITY_DN17279_c0_g1_i1.p1 TRINITY_DN17279_c0_g1~~TRINITY_DN17279_c0_g1_i1.p1  ORF type:complete len:439 (-),score=82.28 TRINITY_DN17279_c0_g1_i1:30-1292(-)